MADLSYQQVVSEISSKGVALQTHFEIHFDLPKGAFLSPDFRSQIDEEINRSTRRVCLSCEQVDIPGVIMATQEHRTYQTRRKMPYGFLVEDINMSVRVSSDMFERKFFESWAGFIQNQETRNFNYPSEYTTNLEIRQYNNEHKLVYAVRLEQAYPLAVIQLTGDQHADNTYYVQNISWTYTKFTPLDVNDNLGSSLLPGRSRFVPNITNIIENIISL